MDSSNSLGLGATRGETDAFLCDLKSNVINNLRDNIHAAWNGWDAADKFEDVEKQDYYMKYIRSLSELLAKVRKY